LTSAGVRQRSCSNHSAKHQKENGIFALLESTGVLRGCWDCCSSPQPRHSSAKISSIIWKDSCGQIRARQHSGSCPLPGRSSIGFALFSVRGMFALSRAEGLDQGIAYRASRKARRERAFASEIQEKPLTPGDQGCRWGKHGEILRMASVWFLYCSVSSFQSSG
jgi:hypothetical protein